MAINPTLEAAIAANPDDASAYLVYADWLQQQGDPRGTLITMQHALEQAPNNTALSEAEREYLSAHQTGLLGPLAEYIDMLPERVWHLGFLSSVKVANSFTRSPDHEGEEPEFAVEELIAMLLDSDSGRFLRELTVGIVTYQDNDYGAVMATLASQPRPLLRSLFLGDFMSEETELNWSSLGDASALYAALPALRSLTIRNGSMQLGEIRLPELRELRIRTGGFSQANLESVLRAHWPRLEILSLQLGSSSYGSNLSLDHLQPLLDGVGIPATLRHLALGNCSFAEDLIPPLARSKVLPQLRELDLSLGTLGNDGAALLVEHAAAFHHLVRLDLSESWVHDDMIGQLMTTFPNAILAKQRYNARYPDDRYIGGGE